jgi:hypothetical protein
VGDGTACCRNSPQLLSQCVREGVLRLRSGDKLKGHGEAEEIASGRGYGAAGEEAGEVEDVEAIVEVLCVGLQAEGTLFFFIEVDAGRQIKRQSGLDASVREVIETVEHLRAVCG